MALVFLLLLASAILGLDQPFSFAPGLWLGFAVACGASAIFLHADGFGFAGACRPLSGVLASQIAYVVGLFMTSRLTT